MTAQKHSTLAAAAHRSQYNGHTVRNVHTQTHTHVNPYGSAECYDLPGATDGLDGGNDMDEPSRNRTLYVVVQPNVRLRARGMRVRAVHVFITYHFG